MWKGCRKQGRNELKIKLACQTPQGTMNASCKATRGLYQKQWPQQHP